MEDAIRLIVTVLFIGLVIVAIVFLGIFFLAPLGKLNGVFSKKSTSTEVVTLPPLFQNISSGNGKSGAGNNTENQASGPVPQSTSGENSSAVALPPQEINAVTPPESTEPVISPSDFRLINQSSQITKSDIPSGAIDLTVGNGAFSPSTLTVQAGSIVRLAFISGDDGTHVFKFDNPVLSSVSLGVGPGGVRILTFVINKTGVYGFHCDVPGHAAMGEVGKLVVN
ncbi:cupredoxin domain-containing protein [Patescibacteria group bacterium]|nr:cupredoxin domain-containing protein [Patescibacteria group bacterium]